MIKAIGKGSLASILAVALHVIRVIVWIAFAGLSAAVVAVPFIPAVARLVAGADADLDIDIDAGDFVEILKHFITFGVLLYVVERLLEILKTLRFGSPFVKENADRFRKLGWALLIGEGSKILIGIFAEIFDAEIDAGLDGITLIAVVAVFVLSEVFREGARMKEEQDLTV